MKIKAIYKDEVLRPLDKLNLSEGEKVEIEISNAVRRTRGIIKIDHKSSKEIADAQIS